MKKTIALLSTLALVACGPNSNNSSGSSGWDSAISKSMDGLQTVTSLADNQVPVLKSPLLAKSWGAPTMEAAPDGRYRLSYRNPSSSLERLVIYGYPAPLPALTSAPDYEEDGMVNDELGSITHTQTFRSTTIFGKPVRWFTEFGGGGADGAYYTTEGFSLTDPSGKTGHYRLVIESVSGAAPARFRDVGW